MDNQQSIHFDLSAARDTVVFELAEFANYPKEAMEGEFLSSLFEIFIDSATRALENMKYALERKDIDRFRNLAHGLKGICGNVKAKQLEAIAYQCQEINRDSFNSGENAVYIINTLQASLNETQKILFAYVRKELSKNC